MKNLLSPVEAKYSQSGRCSKRAFQLYDSDKENRSTLNTRKKSKLKTQQSVDSKYHSGQSMAQSSSSNCREIYIAQLESKVEELTKLLETQGVKLRAANDERNCLRLICEKQQIKLAHTQNRDVEILKEDFKQQLEDLRLQKERIMELVSNINADHQKEIEDLKQEIASCLKAKERLEEDNGDLASENQKLKLQAQMLTSNLMEKDDKLSQLEDQLFEKRNIDRKYRLVLKELEKRDQANFGEDM